MTTAILVKTIIDARYKILVAVRPIGPAREAISLIVTELAQTIRATEGDSAADAFLAQLHSHTFIGQLDLPKE